MNATEIEIAGFMKSVKDRYFPELMGMSFEVSYDVTLNGVMGRAIFGCAAKVILHYSDEKILDPKYRMGLVPIIAHELAHYIDPVDPERVLRSRLPAAMMLLWEELLKSGYAKCSMQNQKRETAPSPAPPRLLLRPGRKGPSKAPKMSCYTK